MDDSDIQRFPDEVTAEQQLVEWAKGNSVHNNNCYYSVVDEQGKILSREKVDGGECCPDFSCCQPEIGWSMEMRQSFMEGSEAVRQEMMMMALGKLMNHAAKEKKVHIAGSAPAEGDAIH